MSPPLGWLGGLGGLGLRTMPDLRAAVGAGDEAECRVCWEAGGRGYSHWESVNKHIACVVLQLRGVPGIGVQLVDWLEWGRARACCMWVWGW